MANGNNDMTLKKWQAFLALVVMIASLTYSISISVSISPLKARVAKAEEVNERQEIKLHDLDKKVDYNKLCYEYIKESLGKIEKILEK